METNTFEGYEPETEDRNEPDAEQAWAVRINLVTLPSGRKHVMTAYGDTPKEARDFAEFTCGYLNRLRVSIQATVPK